MELRLRFVERAEPESYDGAGNITTARMIKVLQFRNVYYPIAGITTETTYSSWQDVPLVKEDD